MTELTTNAVSMGTLIKAARNEKHITIAALARELGVDPRTVAGWQAGRSQPSYTRLAHLAAILGKPPSYFLDGVHVGEGES